MYYENLTGAKARHEDVWVLGAPGQGGDLQLGVLRVDKLPERQQSPLLLLEPEWSTSMSRTAPRICNANSYVI